MWELTKGNTSIQEIAISDKDGNLVTNLADATEIKFQVKKSKTAESYLIQKTKGNGIEVLTGDSLGKLRITIVPSDTKNMDAGWMYYMGLEITWDENTSYEIELSIDGIETNQLIVKQDIVNS
jgi:hypothetical protein